MSAKAKVVGVLLVAGLAVLGAGADYTPALAAGDAVDVARFTVDGGGGHSQAGDYALVGTAGQADAGVTGGEDFALVGGFWGGYPPTQAGEKVYVPFLNR